MGRPLNKKYFGNRNVGQNGYGNSDDFIGGEGIASISWSGLGSWRSGAVSGLALPAPTIPGGVQATWTIKYSVAGVVTGAGKTNLAVGWEGTNTSIPGLVVRVTNISGANAIFEVKTQATPFTTIPFSGNGQGVTFTHSNGIGTAATFLTDVNWQVDATTAITVEGSGYTGAETFTVTTANGTPPAGTIVLTTDTGGQYQGLGDLNVNTYNENAILITAKTTSGGTATTGDIVKQEGSRRYKVKTADGTAVCKLVATASPAVYEATITATDQGGATYYVTKLTAHKALLTSTGTGSPQFADRSSVKWTFGTAVANSSVTIANA